MTGKDYIKALTVEEKVQPCCIAWVCWNILGSR